jgi:hypothetical protein
VNKHKRPRKQGESVKQEDPYPRITRNTIFQREHFNATSRRASIKGIGLFRSALSTEM